MHSLHSRLASSLLPSLPPSLQPHSASPSVRRAFARRRRSFTLHSPPSSSFASRGRCHFRHRDRGGRYVVRPSTAFSLRAPSSASSSSSSSRTLSLNLIKEHSNPPEDCHSCDLCTCLAASFYFLLSFPLTSAPLYFTPTTSAFLFLIPPCLFEI